MHFAFVVPAKNEASTISSLIRDLRAICLAHNWRETIIVVDDSSDDTAYLAQRAGALVIPGGQVGLGQAMLFGLAEALRQAPDWIFSLDSDGQVDTNEIPFFVEMATLQDADVVISSRFLKQESLEYRYPWINWFGNRILVAILCLATARRFTDSHGGLRLMRPHTLANLRLIGRHTYVQETLIHMSRRGYKIIEIPSRWKPRHHGESRVLSSISKYVFRTLPGLLFLLRFHRLCFVIALILLYRHLAVEPISSTLLFMALAFFVASVGVFYSATDPLKIDNLKYD
jgi:glycosyltransferase involved in cell wall biosynthesis